MNLFLKLTLEEYHLYSTEHFAYNTSSNVLYCIW